MDSRLAKKTDNKNRSSTFVAAKVVTLATMAANTEVILVWGTSLGTSPLRCDPLASCCTPAHTASNHPKRSAPCRKSQIEPSPHEEGTTAPCVVCPRFTSAPLSAPSHLHYKI